jgi:hypothetical protein
MKGFDTSTTADVRMSSHIFKISETKNNLQITNNSSQFLASTRAKFSP